MKITKTFFYILLIVSSFSIKAQTVFLENFENKTNGLDITTEGYVLSQSESYTGTVTAIVSEQNGNKFARMEAVTNAAAGMQITKSIAVNGGQLYNFEIDSRGPFKRQLRIYSNTDDLLFSSDDYKPSTTAENTAWKKMSLVFSVPSGASAIKIAFHHYWSGTIDLDNIKVSEAVRQTEFYISNNGNDSNAGTIAAPWQTLDKISSKTLFPGDKVYFNKGDHFKGHFVLSGSGEKGNEILISSYGTGAKPIIDGAVGAANGGDYKEAVLIENQDNIILENLEIRNDRVVTRSGVSDKDGFGITIHNGSDKVMDNFIFRNLTIRDVFAVEPVLDRDSFDSIEVSGMRFTCSRNTEVGKEKNIQNILIEDSYFTNLQRLGIQFKHSGGNDGVGNDEINRNKDIIVRNNEFSYNGGSAVLPNRTYNCLIENNLFDHPGASTDPRMPGRGSSVWNIRSINTVVQYNVCLSTRGYLDSYGIHIDLENENTFIQYNYMDDCEGGFVEILAGNKNAVYRFNVDVNSGFRVSDWNNASSTIYVYSDRWKEPNQAALNLCDGVYINNNTIIVDKGTKTNGDPYTTSITFDSKNTFVYNNIFSSTNNAGIGKRNFAIVNNSPIVVKNNLFEGTVNPDWINMDTNPQIGASNFTNTGNGKFAFQVLENSIAINNGTPIVGPVLPGAGTGVFINVPAFPNVDFYGNPIDLSSGTPNIGAYNGKSNNDILNIADEGLVNENRWFVFADDNKSILNIVNKANNTDEIKVELFTITGKSIFVEKLKVSNKNSFKMKINSKISNGIYILNIHSNGNVDSRKIVLHK